MIIKFRAWKEETNSFVYSDKDKCFHFNDAGAVCALFKDHKTIQSYSMPDSIVRVDADMFTGLEDKNGKDIYEGDLITNKSGRVAKVIWHKFSGCWDCKASRGNGDCRGFIAGDWRQCVEVIGNIHQHPELIRGNNNGA